MKISDGFDARRLRPKQPGHWRVRFGTAIATLLVTLGVLLTMAGASGLIGHPQALGDLDATPAGAGVIAVSGLLVLYLGIWLWRRCRRHRRRARGLSMSAHLMKKHD
ncbi:hypothetical protein ALQ04_00479 [Pseudomonas cichorii]|uniref:Uncharacterized protein n=1 Tax=Pseudomonas cichorii TaxID=36746 RepID=A0A3M4LL29_PSECI|nr:hypothetical protein [Pseudomonas cichorii]RMQ41701.1 hypothetical protein ALQ04_00479 [Pseudomonas cichorii]